MTESAAVAALAGDTIVAIATPRGRGAIAVVRVSGPSAHALGRRVVQPWPAAPRRVTLAAVRDPETGTLVDRTLVTLFEGPHSYTGEDMLEISGHGGDLSPAAIAALFVRLGARTAQPGEFTRRAVLNGKLDLAQAEALLEIVDARTEAARRAALYQAEGGLSRRIAQLREQILGIEALLAYEIDFPEEDDGPLPRERIAEALDSTRSSIAQLLATAHAGEIIRQGALVVIAGPPNVGKSSLFNALLGYQRAIVSETPGTTRDAIEVLLEVDRWPLRLVDTAGIREPGDTIEREGIEVSRRYMAAADLVLACDDDAERLAATCTTIRALTPAPVLAVRTKADLGDPATSARRACAAVAVSARSGDGLAQLLAAIEKSIHARLGPLESDAPVLVRERHRRALQEAVAELSAFEEAWVRGEPPVAIAAVHIRAAAGALESIIGGLDAEDVLDRVFASFCIGK